MDFMWGGCFSLSEGLGQLKGTIYCFCPKVTFGNLSEMADVTCEGMLY